MSQTKRFVVRFTGRVQGVGFRATCKMESSGLSINGFVKNEVDGSVTLDIDATAADGNELIRRIKIARSNYVDKVSVDECDSQNRTDGFHIL